MMILLIVSRSKIPCIKSVLSGYNSHDVRQACAEITGIANFLSSREANQKNISEWHILAAVLGKVGFSLGCVTTIQIEYY